MSAPPNPPISTSGSQPPNVAPTVLDTFTCFLKLPVELQLKVFRIAANIPRLIPHLRVDTFESDPSLEGDFHFDYCIEELRKSLTQQSAILHVCRNSRQEALPFYQRFFNPDIDIVEYSDGFESISFQTPYVFFNPNASTLYFVDMSMLEITEETSVLRNIFEKQRAGYCVKSIAFDVSIVEIWPFCYCPILHLAKSARANYILEEIIVVSTINSENNAQKHGDLKLINIRPDLENRQHFNYVGQLQDELKKLESGIPDKSLAKFPFPRLRVMGVAKNGRQLYN